MYKEIKQQRMGSRDGHSSRGWEAGTDTAAGDGQPGRTQQQGMGSRDGHKQMGNCHHVDVSRREERKMTQHLDRM